MVKGNIGSLYKQTALSDIMEGFCLSVVNAYEQVSGLTIKCNWIVNCAFSQATSSQTKESMLRNNMLAKFFIVYIQQISWQSMDP